MGLQECKWCFIDGTMNTHGGTKILTEKMTPGLQKLGKTGIFQHGISTANIRQNEEKRIQKNTFGVF